MKLLLLFYNFCRQLSAVILSSLLMTVGHLAWDATPAFAASWTSEGQIHLGQRQFLKEPQVSPTEYQKSGTFLWATPSLQYAGDNTRFRFKGIAGLDQSEFDPKDRTQLIPQEFFIEHRGRRFSLLAGLNTFNWGVTDLVNPMDVINPRWMRNPLNPIKIGSPSLALTWTLSNGEIDFVYIPRQFRHELPTVSSRALPRDLSVANYVAEFQGESVPILMPSTPLRFQYLETKDPSKALENNLALRWRQSLGNLDLQAVAFEGIPSFPDFSEPQVTLNIVNFSPRTLELQPDIQLEAKYQRIRLASLGGVWTLPGLLVKFVHAETWRASRDYEISLPRTSVLALEKPSPLFGFEATWLYQFAVVGDSSRLAESVFSTREIFDQSHLLGLRLASGFDWSFTFGGLVNPKSKAQVLQLDYQYRMNDQWQLKLSAQSIQGQEGSLARSLAEASDVQLGFLVFW